MDDMNAQFNHLSTLERGPEMGKRFISQYQAILNRLIYLQNHQLTAVGTVAAVGAGRGVGGKMC
jgi:hypothetical protein